jgi:hypothetical protein
MFGLSRKPTTSLAHVSGIGDVHAPEQVLKRGIGSGEQKFVEQVVSNVGNGDPPHPG